MIEIIDDQQSSSRDSDIENETPVATSGAQQINNNRPPLPHQNFTAYLIYCNMAIILGSSFMFGYNIAVVNGPYAHMNNWLNETNIQHGNYMSAEELNTLWSVSVTLYLLGGIVGSTYIPGLLDHRFGERNSLMIASSLGIIGEILIFISRYTGSHVPFMVGRAVVGVQTGISMVIAPALIGECAPAKHRGACGAMYGLGISIGNQLANLLGLYFILGTEQNWHYLFIVATGLYLLHLAGLFFVVESPRMLEDEGREHEALMALARLRNTDKQGARAEFEEIRRSARREEGEKKISAMTVLRHRELWWPMIITINLHIINELTGIAAVLIYATLVMSTGLGPEMAAISNFGLTFASIIGNITCILLIDHLGRRRMLLAGVLGTVIANVFLIIVLRFNIFEASIAGFAFFLLSFANGPGPIPWFIPGELFHQAAHPIAYEVAMFTNWAGDILVSFVFPIMQFHITYLSFLPFAIVGFLEFVFVLLFLPETMIGMGNYSPDIFAPGKPLIQLGKKCC